MLSRGGAPGVSGMEQEPRPAVISAVVHPDEQHLVGLLLRKIIPTVARIIFDPGGFAAHMGIDKVAGDQIVVGKARAAHNASGESSTGPRRGRNILTMPNRPLSNSS